MVVVGLCGQSGSGKGTVCAICNQMGIPSIDTDRLYHDMIAGPSPCTASLLEAFGPSIATEVGGIDTKRLREIVFSDPTGAMHQALNRITHYYITETLKEQIELHRKEGTPALILDAPMLFESDTDQLCDVTVAVIANHQCKLLRLAERDGLSTEQADLRLLHQRGDRELFSRCDHSISNNGSLDDLRAAVETLFFMILKNN